MENTKMSRQEVIDNSFILYLALVADATRNNQSINKNILAADAVGRGLVTCNMLTQPMVAELYNLQKDYSEAEVRDITSKYWQMAHTMQEALEYPVTHVNPRKNGEPDRVTRAADNYENTMLNMGLTMFKQSTSAIVHKFQEIVRKHS